VNIQSRALLFEKNRKNNPSTKNHVSMFWFMSLPPPDDHYAASFSIDKIKPESQIVAVDSGRSTHIRFAI